MNKREKDLQYYTKISGALNELFNEDSEYFIDISNEDFDVNKFLYCLGVRVPQMVMYKLTSEKRDPLDYLSIMTRLLLQDSLENQNK
jgi:hypothetical protein